jgi:hypothetical protein
MSSFTFTVDGRKYEGTMPSPGPKEGNIAETVKGPMLDAEMAKLNEISARLQSLVTQLYDTLVVRSPVREDKTQQPQPNILLHCLIDLENELGESCDLLEVLVDRLNGMVGDRKILPAEE